MARGRGDGSFEGVIVQDEEAVGPWARGRFASSLDLHDSYEGWPVGAGTVRSTDCANSGASWLARGRGDGSKARGCRPLLSKVGPWARGRFLLGGAGSQAEWGWPVGAGTVLKQGNRVSLHFRGWPVGAGTVPNSPKIPTPLGRLARGRGDGSYRCYSYRLIWLVRVGPWARGRFLSTTRDRFSPLGWPVGVGTVPWQ